MLKFGGDKIALLGLFVAALLLARLIVISRSSIILSEPVELTHGGLSVSMPAGNGWKSSEQWRYMDSGFTLSSSLAGSSGSPVAWAHCRYLLAAEPKSPAERFESKAAEIEGRIVKVGRAEAGEITIDWAQMEKAKTLFSMFFGTGRLPDNRQFEIEVTEIAGERAMAERVFKKIVESISFRDEGLLETGAEVVSGVQSKGLGSFFENRNQQEYFLIKDVGRRPVGFSVEILVDSGAPGGVNIRGASLLYMTKGRARSYEHATFFESDDSFTEYVWHSETVNGRSMSRADITARDGRMTVSKSVEQRRERNYQLSAAAIPAILLKQVLVEMLDCDRQELVVDIVESGGRVSAVYISLLESDESGWTGEKEAEHVFQVELLNGRGGFERIYVDGQGWILGRLSRMDDGFIFERSDAESLARRFPAHSEYLLKGDRAVEWGEPEN
ncbi:MAG: hypothetical protein JSU94_06730 [Phycisphaerales bacterium]|nr:MAG: hypothetical protein JSU94_06730 [Phycisphaerales bacterium]